MVGDWQDRSCAVSWIHCSVSCAAWNEILMLRLVRILAGSWPVFRLVLQAVISNLTLISYWDGFSLYRSRSSFTSAQVWCHHQHLSSQVDM